MLRECLKGLTGTKGSILAYMLVYIDIVMRFNDQRNVECPSREH